VGRLRRRTSRWLEFLVWRAARLCAARRLGGGTYYGENSANGTAETITIQPDGTVELRTHGKAPEYGTFAGETLTVGSRISKVEPARGGIVIDGSYYRR